MGREEVLSRLVTVGVLLVARPAFAQDERSEALRLPRQVTVGVTDQFLGQLSADGALLYFVSNRNTTSEIYVQDIEDGRAKLLFDDGADATWPRISPDGRHLLYISFRDSSSGQLCVRDLPGGEGRRCLTDAGTAVQAEWLSTDRIALLGRASVSENLRLFAVAVAGQLSAQPLAERNLTGLAASPDGRWLVYVPTVRYAERVGPGLAARATQGLEALRVDQPALRVPIPLDLPGTSGQVAFSRDGRWLYVTQFYSDSNHDGLIDAADHGVLFRVPFDSAAPEHTSALMPEQLTEASWNCQYPAPAARTLLASCTRLSGGLDVYELPLDGEVPPQLDADRLRSEIDLTNRRVEELLLTRHLLAKETDRGLLRQRMMRLVQLHLEQDEFDAAEHYALRLHKVKDAATRGLTQPLVLLIQHRRATRERERGRMSPEFHEDARQRAKLLLPEVTDSPAALALNHLVRSEIADTLGDKGEARKELEAAQIDDVAVPTLLRAYYERADALYRGLDDRDALIAACTRLAQHGKLEPKERLQYARAAVRAITRGRSFDEADALLAAEQPKLSGELAFAAALARLLLTVRDVKPPPATREALANLYRAQPAAYRQRALMIDAVARAGEVGADRLVETLAQLYVDAAAKGSQERQRAERLYRKVMLGRAYRRMAAERPVEARAELEKVVTQTGSLEALVALLDLRLQAGDSPSVIAKDYTALSETIAHFVSAYLEARGLPLLLGAAHDEAVRRAITHLRAAWPALKQDRGAQALYGAIRHETFLMHGDLASAAKANSHYLAALALLGQNPRYRAMVLSQLALLQAQVGNFHIALDYFDRREKLPYADDAGSLAVAMSKARVLLHVGQEGDAATAADKALAMVERVGKLAEFRVLALDRAALYNLAADRFARALALYDAELPLLQSEHNVLLARLGRAAAALGAKRPESALADLAFVARGLGSPHAQAALQWPHMSIEESVEGYKMIHAGLLANAYRQLGALDKAATALASRRALFRERLARGDQEEDLAALALIELRLADNAGDDQKTGDAAKWVDEARAHAAALLARTQAPLAKEALDVLWFAATLVAFEHAALPFDVYAQLQAAHARVTAANDPFWRSYQRWFEIYLALTAPLSN